VGANFKRLVDLDKILLADDDVQYDIDCVLINLVTSTTQKWRTFKFLNLAQVLNRFVDLDEILYGGDGIEYYLDYILLNTVASTIPKWLTFKLLRWV
jgi:hypothetical protein